MRLRPSAASVWSKCGKAAHYAAAEPEKPPEEEHPVTRAGTAWHWYLSETLEGREPAEDDVAPNGVAIDSDMILSGKAYVNRVRRVAGDNQIFVETELAMTTIHPELKGTCDTFCLDWMEKVLHVWDGKYGYTPVDAWRNMQGVCYTTGIIEKYDLPDDWTVKFTIVQPRDFANPVKTWETNVGEILYYAHLLSEAALVAFQPNPPAVTGPQCKYCPGRASCDALRISAASAVEVSMETDARDLDPYTIGLELETLMQAYERIGFRLQGLQQVAEHTLKTGGRVPGWQLTKTRGAEKWTCDEKQLKALEKVAKVALFKPKALTPKQARDAGLPKSVTDMYAERPEGFKLERDNAEKIFG